MVGIIYHPGWNKDCSSKFRSKHSTNTVLCLLRNLLEQSLGRFMYGQYWFLLIMHLHLLSTFCDSNALFLYIDLSVPLLL